MSRFLEEVCEEAKVGNKFIINSVRFIGNKFFNVVEISVQESVHLYYFIMFSL